MIQLYRLEINVLSLLSLGQLQQTLIPEQRSAAQEDAGIRCDVEHQLFPESVDRDALVKADLSIPTLHESLTEEVNARSNPKPG